MPRLANGLRRQAWSLNPLLLKLLPTCRSMQDAQSEIRWLEEHARRKTSERKFDGTIDGTTWQERLYRLVNQRAKGVPLQYLLGSEFFGALEIRCKPDVLIPRPETANIIAYLASRIRGRANAPSNLRVLDLCTGTGCIPLLFQHVFHDSAARLDVIEEPTQLQTLGVDISNSAVTLARKNRRTLRNGRSSNTAALKSLRFEVADILYSEKSTRGRVPSLSALLKDLNCSEWDVLLSNPPYISPRDFLLTTSRSVRRYEPKLALVPPSAASTSLSDSQRADRFYPRLLDIADEVTAKLVMFEVADLAQALRVARLAATRGAWDVIEIWKDGDLKSIGREENFRTRGQRNGRAVVCWRAEASTWLNCNPP